MGDGRTLVGGLELFVVDVCRQGVASSCGAKLGRLGLLPLTTDPAYGPVQAFGTAGSTKPTRLLLVSSGTRRNFTV